MSAALTQAERRARYNANIRAEQAEARARYAERMISRLEGPERFAPNQPDRRDWGAVKQQLRERYGIN